MKFWNIDQLARDPNAPGEVFDVALAVVQALVETAIAPIPRLVSIGITDDDDGDVWRYELDIELTPGLNLPVECGLLELSEYDDVLSVDDVVHDVLEAVHACGPRVDELSSIVHDARTCARRTLARWQEQGTMIGLIDVRLAPYDHWRGDSDPNIEILVESLDDRFARKVQPINAGKLSDIVARLEEERPDLAHRLERRAALHRLGASGTIERVAFNALSMFGDVAGSLRALAQHRRYHLPDNSSIVMIDGHVSLVSGIDRPVQWCGDWLHISGAFVPEHRLARMVGRPVSELSEQDFLSPDMLIVEANCEVTDGIWSLNIRYSSDRRLFCLSSGRVWDEQVACDDAERNTAPAANVVPFRRCNPVG